MKIKVWSKKDKINQRLSADTLENTTPTYTIEIPNEEIDHFIDRFGEKFGEAFGKAIVKGLEAGD